MFDQTKMEWQRKAAPEELGTGIVLLRSNSPEVFKPSKKMLIPNVRYDQFKNKVKELDAIAMKWVPGFVASYEALLAAACEPKPCTETCVQPGCICDPDECVCR
jgi:hypothetical protein